MAMIFTDTELRQVIAWSEWRTAKSLGIIDEDDVFFDREDAVAIISQLKGHRDALQRLADAYGAWYAFHLEIYKAGKSGNLSADESAKLVRLTGERKAAKDALIALTPL
jgi:hypothetical protein